MVGAALVGKRIPLLGRQRVVMSLRGLSGFIALVLHFYTIARLPLGTAVMLNYTAPIFTALLAILFLKERPSPLLLSMIALAFFGVFLLVEGKMTGWNGTVFLGILSAFFASIAYISIRAIKQKESPLTIIFYFTGISTLGSLFFIPFGFIWPSFTAWVALIGVGIGSYFGQLWMTVALRRTRAAVVTPFSYFTPLLSFCYGFLFWKEPFSAAALLGAGLIILAGSVISYFETKVKPTTGEM